MFKLFDSKTIFTKLILTFCVIALIWNISLTYENDRLVSKLILQTQLFTFCHQLELNNVVEAVEKIAMSAMKNDIHHLDLITEVMENTLIIEKTLQTLQKRIIEKNPIKDIEKIKKANFLIHNQTWDYKGSGTHIKLNNKHYVLTCAHLSKENTDEMVITVNDNEIYCLELIKINEKKDLALYSIDKNNLPYLELSEDTPKEGSEVAIIGNPMIYDDIVTDGIIAKIFKDYYIVTNIAYYGSSGGALLYKGKIIGVVSMIETYCNLKRYNFVNLTRCINIVVIREFLEGIE